MQGTIDRFEDDFAVVELENGKIVNFKKSKIPKEAKEGDVIIIGNEKIYIDDEMTKKRKQKIDKLMKKLFDKT